MLLRNAPDIRSSEITDKKLYLRRREFIRAAAMTTIGAATGTVGPGSSRSAVVAAREDSGSHSGRRVGQG